jgi:hypothetical protein
MKTRNIILLIIALFISNFCLMAQALLPKKAQNRPAAYTSPLSKAYYGPLDMRNPLENMHWFVFSDRENNISYTDPQKSNIAKKIGYLERFLVAEVRGDFVHIYQDDYSNFPNISPDAVDFGWVAKDNLILSTHCLLNEHGFEKKALMLQRLAQIDDMSKDNIAEIRFYGDPELKQFNGKTSVQFEIYFVFKISKDASSVLLGKEVSLGIGKTEELKLQMVGWADIKNITFWDQRICLEPNWDPRAVDERSAKKIPPLIFLEESSCLNFQKNLTYDKNYIARDHEPGKTRYAGAFTRFPVISVKSNGIMKTGVMGKVFSEGKESSDLSSEKLSEVKQEFENIKNQAKNLNIVFVVDGTNSMGPYFKPISGAIKKSFETLKGDYSSSNIRFGGVIYRDFADGDRLTDVQPLTSNVQTITSFFDTARTDYKGDKDVAEAVFYGLKTALTSLNLQPDQSNFIILVGDAGSHERQDASYVSEDEVIKLLSNLECSIICFQVNNGKDKEFDKFNRQSADIILKTAKNVKNKDGNKKLAWRPEILVSEDPYFKIDGNKFFLYNQPIYGYFMFAEKEQTLPGDVLLMEIHNMINTYDNTISKWLIKTEEVIDNGVSVENVVQDEFSYSEGIINFLSKIKNLSKGQIKALVHGTKQYSITGYAISDVKPNLKYPLFKNILFLSHVDLAGTLDKLDALCNYSYNTNNELRTRLYNSWIEILKNHLGDLDISEYETKTMAELQLIVFGVPAHSELLTQIKLRDIKDEKNMEFDKIMMYQSTLKKTYNEISEISASGDYKYSFRSNNLRYYWIDIGVFP